ncbi:MAG: hypothetical protein IJE00_00195 [Clostridia bacterium]|nr:hypothetical protein [Clostridia bacterium]
MIQPNLNVIFQMKNGVCTPTAPQYAGVQGDNGRCLVGFLPPDATVGDSVYFRIEMVNGCGSLVVGDLQKPDNVGLVSQRLTRPFTQAGGRCCVRLIATEFDQAGNELSAATVMTGTVYFDDREAENLPVIKHSLSEMLMAVAKDAEVAERCADTAELAAAQAVDKAAVAEEIADGLVTEVENRMPLFAVYGQTTYDVISEAYKSGRMVYLVYGNLLGFMTLCDHSWYAQFAITTSTGKKACAQILKNGNVWSIINAPYVENAAVPQFTSYTLTAYKSMSIPKNAFITGMGERLSLSVGGGILLSDLSYIQLHCTNYSGTHRAIVQYQFNSGACGSLIADLTGGGAVVNDTGTNATLHLLVKEG